jgi:nicotinate-nucleotide pyrophosphorylase (carboxylating)
VKEFRQIEWDERTADDCRQLVRLAVREDLDRGCDLTTLALVPETARGRAHMVARQPGIMAGMPAAQVVLDEMDLDAELAPCVAEAARLEAGTQLAILSGSTRDLLTAERIILNLVGRLCGIATVTRNFVDRLVGTGAQLYDTRKTTPGWRRLEKYAVRCGGGHNHRTGLFDAILIKDNHLAQGAGGGLSPPAAVLAARRFLAECRPDPDRDVVEIEVDTLMQLQTVLSLAPDIVLLDNMSLADLRQAVRLRDAAGVPTQLEASGGVRLETIAAMAATGVERISVGAITHSAVALDIGLDWETTSQA